MFGYEEFVAIQRRIYKELIEAHSKATLSNKTEVIHLNKKRRPREDEDTFIIDSLGDLKRSD